MIDLPRSWTGLVCAGLLLGVSGLYSDAVRAAPDVQLRCLAQNIYFEARGEPEQGKLAVAEVTLNRVRSPKFPDTVCEVVWQPAQFSWTADGKPDVPRHIAAWRRALAIARLALGGLRPYTIRGATYYHATSVYPRWAVHLRLLGRLGKHRFYASS